MVLIPPLLFGSTSGATLRTEWRKIEDKMVSHNIELRTFCLNLNTSQVHQNRELPSAYVCWIGVADMTLLSKGTAHRALKGKDAEKSPPQVNVLLGSDSLTCSL